MALDDLIKEIALAIYNVFHLTFIPKGKRVVIFVINIMEILKVKLDKKEVWYLFAQFQ